MKSQTRIRMVGRAFLTLENDNLCLSGLGEETKKLIKECPLLNSLTIDYTSDIKVGGIFYSVTDLLKDPDLSSSSLFNKSWSNRASGACGRFQDLNGINETLTIKKKKTIYLNKSH